MQLKPDRRTLAVEISIFILVPLLVSSFLFLRMISVLHSYMEEQVSEQASILSQLAYRRLNVRLAELEQVASYLADGRVPEAEMGSLAEGTLQNPSRTAVGILRLDGTAVSGNALQFGDYPAIRNAFRGNNTVRYREDEGLFFTVPIYNHGNVKYALYESFDQQSLFENFEDAGFHGEAKLMLADASRQLVVPIKQNSITESDPWFQRPEVRSALARLSAEMDTSALGCVYIRSGGEKSFFFASNLNQSGLYLVGIVPQAVIAGNTARLMQLVILVFGLLEVLLAIGAYRVLEASGKARESDALREAKLAAEEASRSKGQFLASMSHELRTPINTIMGMDEMILRETNELDTRERAMDIKSASQILMGLINDVLDFSKIESGRLNIIPVEYNLANLIRDSALLTENRARQKSLAFQMEVAESLPIGLYGDDIRIQQVLTNLLTNAVKYTPAGVVTLRVHGSCSGDDTVLLHFEIADTGIGIKEDDLPKIMDLTPFTRIDETRNRTVEGSGLGLPIIINLLRLMGSELRVKSVYGKGSVFSFDLRQRIVDSEPIGDIRQRLAESVRTYTYKTALIAPRAKVLMVDDNAMNRKIFISLLKQSRIQVTAVSSGQKCLELVQQEHFDLIFMDHLMPEMDGVETLHRLKALENNLSAGTPVVILTANAFSGARQKYLELGFDDFLSKPIATERLEAMLIDMLPPELLEEGEAAPQPVEQEELPEIEGVNWRYAETNISDRSLLWDSLKEFYGNLPAEMETLNGMDLSGPERLGDYRIRVHSLKSSTAMVGLLSVSELARLLEHAAERGDTAAVQALHPLLLKQLEETRGQLEPWFRVEKPAEKPAAQKAELSGLLDMLRMALDQLDISAADNVLTLLGQFSYGEEQQADIDRLAALVKNLQFAEAAELLDKLQAE